MTIMIPQHNKELLISDSNCHLPNVVPTEIITVDDNDVHRHYHHIPLTMSVEAATVFPSEYALLASLLQDIDCHDDISMDSDFSDDSSLFDYNEDDDDSDANDDDDDDNDHFVNLDDDSSLDLALKKRGFGLQRQLNNSRRLQWTFSDTMPPASETLMGDNDSIVLLRKRRTVQQHDPESSVPIDDNDSIALFRQRRKQEYDEEIVSCRFPIKFDDGEEETETVDDDADSVESDCWPDDHEDFVVPLKG